MREQSINVTTYKPDTDKRARLIAQTDLFAGGSVRLPRRAGWLEEFVAELLAFPGGHDDQVDALAQGLAWGRRQWGRQVRMQHCPWALLGVPIESSLPIPCLVTQILECAGHLHQSTVGSNRGWIYSRTYQMGGEKSGLRLVAGTRSHLYRTRFEYERTRK